MVFIRKLKRKAYFNIYLSRIVIVFFSQRYFMSRLSSAIFAVLLLLLAVPAFSTSSYRVASSSKNTTTITLNLEYTGKDDYYIKPTSPISKSLVFTFHTLSFNDFTFKIIDAKNKRFQVPQYGVFPIDPLANFSFPIAAAAVHFEYTENPFDFKITRKQTGSVLFSTYNQKIIFSDHYLEIGTEVDSDFIYGIGERFSQGFRKRDGKWTIFNRDRGQVQDLGEGLQTYGYYPYYLMRERGNFFHVNYFRSSNAMDVIKSRDSNTQYVTYKVIGGVLDFRFFLGEQSPEATIEKLNFYAGKAEIPPFWSFGFHQCKYGYPDADTVLNVLANYEKNGLPLDTIWTDIDYMVNYEDFTIDETRFPLDKMKNITDRYKWIPIIDAGIKNSGYAYEEGLKRGVYVMEAGGKKPYVGKVWPGPTTFVDFFHPNSNQYWQDMLDLLYKKAQFSGLWIDMNQYANFCDGACSPPSDPSTFDYSKDLPYQPGSDNIQSHTISLNTTHYGNLSQADVHAFAAFLQTYATNQYLKSKGMKPFIISRSSTFGSSKYGFHWTGDNYAAWSYLKGSISDNFNSQMAGFQMVGADICGFGGNTTEELCARWFQLGSLYTFARDHSDKNSKSQEPYALGDAVLGAAKTNLKLRYSFLKYIFTLFINKKGLGTIWKPLFFEFPLDLNTYIDDIADSQFLLGPNLMVTPILEAGTTQRKVYFPQTSWINFQTGDKNSPGTSLLKDVELTDPVPIFLREGSIIFTQQTDGVVNTKQLNNIFLLSTGLVHDTRRSNISHQVYESIGSILSIKDYNDNTLVEICLREGCEYIFTMVATITSTSRILQLNVAYLGGLRLNEQVLIYGINMGFGEEVIEIRFEQPLEVTGPKKFTIPIPPQSKANLQTEIA